MNKWIIRSQRTGHSLRKVRYSSGYCINITGWFYAWSTFRWWVSLQHSIYSIPAFSRASIPCSRIIGCKLVYNDSISRTDKGA